MVRSPLLSLAAAAALALATAGGVASAQAAPGPWQILRSVSPDPTKVDNSIFTGVSMASASEGWAVGSFSTPQAVNQPLAEHWNGKTWSLIKTPDPGAFGSALESITALSASDIWAVGQTQSSAKGPVRTLTEHFNGTSWTVAASPDPGTAGNDELFAVASPGGHQLDTVGGAAVAGDPCLTDVSGTFCLRTLALHTTSG